jgi:hypothetical protein
VTACGALAGAWIPPWSVELLDELELDEPELEFDALELDDELLPVLVVAAWLEPGRTATTTPATATLARPTVTVVAFSRRRPCSRSATANATWRARLRASCSCQSFTPISVTCPPARSSADTSEDVLNVPAARTVDGGLRVRAELPVFSNAQRRLRSRSWSFRY